MLAESIVFCGFNNGTYHREITTQDTLLTYVMDICEAF